MRPVAPRIPGLEEQTIAEEQEEYLPVTVAVRLNANYPSAVEIITRWTFTAEERARVANGEDIYVTQISFTGMMTPINVGLSEEG